MGELVKITTDYIYNTIAAPVVSELCAFVLVFGAFEVFLRSPFFSGDRAGFQLLFSFEFLRRFFLLGAVVLLTAYMTMSYAVHFSHSVKSPIVLVDEGEEGPSDLPWMTNRSMTIAKVQLLSLIPIDLLGIASTLVIFVIVARGAQGKISSAEELKYLFFMASIWHAIWVVWWAVYSLSSPQSFPWVDIIFHSAYSLAHIILFFTAHFVYKKKSKEESLPRVSRSTAMVVDWTYTILFSGMLFSAYAYRMWLYADRLVTGKLQ